MQLGIKYRLYTKAYEDSQYDYEEIYVDRLSSYKELILMSDMEQNVLLIPILVKKIKTSVCNVRIYDARPCK